MSDLTPHDRGDADAKPNVDVYVDVDANSSAVMVVAVCAAFAFLGTTVAATIGIVRIAGQPDGTNKLRALMPWGHKVEPAKPELPTNPPAEIE